MKVTERFLNLIEEKNFSFINRLIEAGKKATFNLPQKIRVGRQKSKFSGKISKEVTEHNFRLAQTLKNCEKQNQRVVLAIPSISFEPEDLENIVGIVHYEGRGLCEVLTAAGPGTKVLFVTSTPIPEEAKAHLLGALPNYKEARKRVMFLSLNDERTDISLSDKILECPKLVDVIRSQMEEGISYMCPFISTASEWKLAEKLGIPVYGPHPALDILQTKSKCREVFSKAGIGMIAGAENLYSCEEMALEIYALLRRRDGIKRLMVKLNIGVSGDGNAVFSVPADWTSGNLTISKILKQMESMEYQANKMTFEKFKRKLETLGGIVEEFVEGENKSSPSIQFFIHPNGRAECLSTHDQILDSNGMSFLGSMFPACNGSREIITRRGQRVADVLAQMGVVGTVGIDFLKTGDQIYPIEINMRRGGTTHPYHTARLLTGGSYDEATGTLVTKDGTPRIYLSNDNYVSLRLKGKSAYELLEFLKGEGVLFSSEGNGAVLHLLSALQDFGKFGYTIIGKNQEEILALDMKLRDSLEYFVSRGVA